MYEYTIYGYEKGGTKMLFTIFDIWTIAMNHFVPAEWNIVFFSRLSRSICLPTSYVESIPFTASAITLSSPPPCNIYIYEKETQSLGKKRKMASYDQRFVFIHCELHALESMCIDKKISSSPSPNCRMQIENVKIVLKIDILLEYDRKIKDLLICFNIKIYSPPLFASHNSNT